jgi:lantibiotic transport system ATP-binding protein
MQKLSIATYGLSRRFGQLTAVDELDLRVPAGSIYGFLGPNGAGKTTTIRMLLGLIRPTQGKIELMDSPLERERPRLLGRVGALVESPSLYPHLTGRENLELTRRMLGAHPQQVERALHIVRLQDSASRLVGQYSMGMRQRLGLACALLAEPELLILDEPTNGLDPAGIHEMRDLITRLPKEQGVTVFLSSHLLNEVEQMATHIGIIQQGKLLFQGTPGQLQAQLEDSLILGVDQLERAEHILAGLGWSVQRHVNGHERLVIKVNGTSDAAMLNTQLVMAGINVYHLSVDQPSLEQIFLKLTQAQQA